MYLNLIILDLNRKILNLISLASDSNLWGKWQMYVN